MRKKTAQFQKYESKVKLSLMLIMLFLVSSNFAVSFFLKRTEALLMDTQLRNYEYIAELCRSYLSRSSDIKDALYHLNADLNKVDDDIIVDVISRRSLMESNYDNPYFSSSKIEDAFAGVESYAYYPETKTQIGYLPLKSDSGGGVQLVMIISRQLLWMDVVDQSTKWDNIFRISSALSVLIFGYFLIKMITKPYKKIRSIAGMSLGEFPLDSNDPEYAEKAFDSVVEQLRRKEEELREMAIDNKSNNLGLSLNYEYILGGISSGVLIYDNDGNLLKMNKNAADILGMDNHSEIGVHYSLNIYICDEIKFLIKEALDYQRIYSRVEIKLGRSKYDERILGATSSLIKDENANLLGVAILLIDLTKIKKVEKENAYKEKMAALGEMTAGMAHEIRNSAAAIAGFGKLITKFIEKPQKVKELSEDIIRESAEMEIIMKRFLAFAKPLDLETESCDIQNLIAETIENIRASNPNMNIIVKSDITLAPIKVDGKLIKQCLYNLLQNSIDAFDKSDNIVIIKSKKYKFPLLYESPTDNLEYLKIMIADNGEGIEPRMIERIFNPFFTGKDAGTGLGLAIVKKIINEHKGFIRVHSRPGKGTIFSVFLPMETSSNTFNSKVFQENIISKT